MFGGKKPNEPFQRPLKCWDCVEEHLSSNFPHRKENSRTIYNFQEASIIFNDVAKGVPRIYASLEDRQI